MIEGNMVISGNYAPATILSLDKDALERILRLLCAKSLSKLRCVNRYFRELVENEMLWQSHVDVGWQKWSAELAEQRLAGRSRELYAFRAMLDSEAKRKLSELVWPLRRKAAEEWFAAHNVNVMDVLERMRNQQWPLQLGTHFWAERAMTCVQRELCCQEIKRIIVIPPADLAPFEFVKGAMCLTVLHYPWCDFSDVFTFITALSQELKRRMSARGVEGGLPALHLLSGLLFGPVPPATSSSEGAQAVDASVEWNWEREKAGLVVPTDGYGLGLQGDVAHYHDKRNLFLPYVLTRRRGRPVSLAIIHAAVGRGAGLDVNCVAIPGHFVTVFGPADDPDERFIDGFCGGQLYTRAEMGVRIGGIASLDRTGQKEVYFRLASNLAGQYMADGQHAHELQLVLTLLLALQPGAHFLHMRAEVAEAQGDWISALKDWQTLLARPNGRVLGDPMHQLNRLERGARQFEWDCELPRRRKAKGQTKYRIGEIMKHRQYGYRGVVWGWDERCAASEEWIEEMGVDKLEGGALQPFYKVLVDVRDRPLQSTYVAHGNIDIQRTPLSGRVEDVLEVQHPDVGMYFDGYLAEQGRYQPNAFLQFRYPDDWPDI